MKKKVIQVAAFLFFNFYMIKAQPPSFVPVSPEASSLLKMTNYPVNFYTGVPDISVPLGSFSGSSLQLPLTLSYHAGGFKSAEHSNRAGLGWSMSSDLQITRSVNGRDDFDGTIGYLGNSLMKAHYQTYPQSYATHYPLQGPYDWVNAFKLHKNEVDGMPDKFSYKLLNKSGSFYFRKNDAGNGYDIVPIPFDNIRIVYSNGNFTITDTDGTIYTFGYANFPGSNLSAGYRETTGSTITSWKCGMIMNSNRTDTLSFTYSAKPTEHFYARGESMEVFTKDAQPDCYTQNYYTSNYIATWQPYLTDYESLIALYPFHQLSTPKYFRHFNGKPSVFHLPFVQIVGGEPQITDRTFQTDGTGNIVTSVNGLYLTKVSSRMGSVHFSGSDKLTKIELRDYNNGTLRSFDFFHSSVYYPYTSLPPTIYLDSLIVKGSDNGRAERYQFLYKSKNYFGDGNVGKDAWGYSNQATTTNWETISIPNTFPRSNFIQRFYSDCYSYIDNVSFSIGDNTHNEHAAKNAAQNGILKRIIYPTGGFVDFSFESNKYKEAGAGNLLSVQHGAGLRIRSVSFFEGNSTAPATQKYYKYGELEDGIGIALAAPPRQFKDGNFEYEGFSFQQEVAYVREGGSYPHTCTDRSCLFLITKEKKTTYLPASSQRYDFLNGSPIYYTKVTEYNIDHGKETGKTVYGFYNPNEFTTLYPQKIPGTNIDFLHTEGMMGLAKYVYQYEFKGGKFTLAHSKDMEYTKVTQPALVKVVYSFNKGIVNVVSGNFTALEQEMYNPNVYFGGVHGVDGFQAGEYGLEVAKVLLTKETEKIYQGSQILTTQNTYHYPTNGYLFPERIETLTSEGKVIKRTLKRPYDFSSASVFTDMVSKNIIEPVVEELVTQHESYYSVGIPVRSSRTVFDYFNGNLLLPKYIDVASGYEAYTTEQTFDLYDDLGNLLQSTAKGGIVTSYVWGYGKRYLLGEISGASLSTIQSFLNTSTIQAFTNESDLMTAFSSLRSSMPSAFIRSFTYLPGVGITSITAANGLSEYYQYDHLARLLTVKDQQNRVLKRNEYLYYNSATSLGHNLFTSITPEFESYNKINPEGPSTIYNFTQPGGTRTVWDSYNPYPYYGISEHEAKSHLPSDKDGVQTATVLMQLYFWVDPYIYLPEGVYVDFIKDGHVVFTRRFQYNYNHDPIDLYVPEGEYILNVRVEDNFINGILSNHFYSTSYGSIPSNYVLMSGPLTVSFTNGVIYSVTVMNY